MQIKIVSHILLLLSGAATGLLMTGCSRSADEATSTATDSLPETIVFNEHIRPIFSKNCSACHGGVKKSGGLSFVFHEDAMVQGASGNTPIVPGDPDASYLLKKVRSTDPKMRMPPPEHGEALSGEQIALLERWIEQGAKWEEPWALLKPVAQTPPVIEGDDWSKNAIDSFILERLQQEGLRPSKEAEKGALLRRVSLDLTGLPPTAEELDAFLANEAEDAYEQEVDRLLASPGFGERWATLWLDLARYADSKGLGQDAKRQTVFLYRDWVIRAFNADMPFDEFTVRQIAGDLLPDATMDDFLATTFHRNTSSEDEGGTSDEEFRVVAQMDRVNTTWQVWHGTTMGCVQCHSHPYDPIRHDEYYQFMDFFNNSQDGDLRKEQPLMSIPVNWEHRAQVGSSISESRKLKEAIWKSYDALFQSTAWTWIDKMKVKSNKPGQVNYDLVDAEGRQEFVFKGTPALIWQTIEAPVPEFEQEIQALQFLVRPDDLEQAPYKASPGFRMDEIKVTLLSTNGQKRVLAVDKIFRDEPFPFLGSDPRKSPGFAALNYMFFDRWAVFRFETPFKPAPGDSIKVEFKHGGTVGQKDLLFIRRGAVALTDDARWRTHEQAEEQKALATKLNEAQKKVKVGHTVDVLVMLERPEHLRRPTKTFVRGNWTELGEVQHANTPSSFHPLPDSGEPKRLQMARWLVDEENPLSARVLVCRFWEQLFGVGIVETLEDFGSIGLPPSHPELLDYLAVRLMNDFDWSMKKLLRLMVTSAAYRQDNATTPALNQLDPKNRLLARGPRVRLTGEMIRDQCLALGGVLNRKMYGWPVMPEQPEGGWLPGHGAAGPWKQSSRDEANRRSIYVHWQRTSVYPVFTAFDAPNRELCSDRRVNSNTPVQPLFTLNDPALFKATQHFGDRIRTSPGSLEEQIAYGYRLALSEEISPVALETLTNLHHQVLTMYPENEAGMKKTWDRQVDQHYQKKRYEAKKANKKKEDDAKKKKVEPKDLVDLSTIARGPADEYDYDAERAAYDNVAAVIMNMDAILNK